MQQAGKVRPRQDAVGRRHALLRGCKLEACDFGQQEGCPAVQGPGSRGKEKASSEEDSRLDTVSERYPEKVMSDSEWLVTLFQPHSSTQEVSCLHGASICGVAKRLFGVT